MTTPATPQAPRSPYQQQRAPGGAYASPIPVRRATLARVKTASKAREA